MQTSPQPRYSPVAQLLHWLVAILIVAQFVLARIAGHLPFGIRKLAVLAQHKSVGMSILVLAIIRLGWRFTHRAPARPNDMSRSERGLAHLSRVGLYGLLFLMPLSGWIMSSAKNYSVSWFGLFTWPNLVSPNEAAFNFFRRVHQSLSILLMTVAALHLLAAMKHHFWNKDDVLLRMLPRFKRSSESSKTSAIYKT
jgi:cytochrome b561